MENLANNFAHIPGWGIDADPKNDPTYPMKHRTNEEHKGYTWERPTQQALTADVLHSIERPNVTAVFGTSVPLRGLSGLIRRYAFQYSESHYGHWLPLLMADRVDVVEGVLDDLMQGSVPNFFAEKGGKAVWKHDRKQILLKVAIGALLVGTVVASIYSNNKQNQNES